MSLPPFNAVSDALDFDPTQEGLFDLWNGISTWKVKKAFRLHEAPVEGGDIVTVLDLVKMRVASLTKVLENWGINLNKESSRTLVQTVQSYSKEILGGLDTEGAVWKVIGNTRTMIVVDDRGHAHVVDASQEDFRDPEFVDYTTLWEKTDGGVRLKESEIRWDITGTISGEIFRDISKSGGWNRSLDELIEHPLVKAMIPDKTLRAEYLTALGVMDMLQISDRWSQSIWVPHELPEWFMRWIALGIKANAFYPPNLKTIYFNLLMRSEVVE